MLNTLRGRLYDWQPNIELSPEDEDFGLYFVLILRQLKPSKVGRFLDHQLVKNYQRDVKTFDRQVRLLVADCKDLFSVPESILEATTGWFDEQATRYPAVGEPGSGVRWTGSKVDFVKLVYCLHIAG